jgi:acetyl-CoA carboxylase biotin carboxyl carrier protein
VSDSKISYEELLQIVKIFESSPEFNELHLKYGDVEIDLSKKGAGPGPAVPQPVAQAIAPPVAPQPAAQPVVAPKEKQPAQAAAAPAPAEAIPAHACIVKSPMVGTFYCAPEPGAAPFVKVGQRVTAETTVCIIEVMKLMNSIQAGYSGVVTQVLVNDGSPVEFGQALIVIDPNA